MQPAKPMNRMRLSKLTVLLLFLQGLAQHSCNDWILHVFGQSLIRLEPRISVGQARHAPLNKQLEESWASWFVSGLRLDVWTSAFHILRTSVCGG